MIITRWQPFREVEDMFRQYSKDGVLRVRIPKTAATTAKPISIEIK